MLLSFQGVKVSQRTLVKAADLTVKIKEHGMLVSELAQAVKKITPDFVFWFKKEATLKDLDKLIKDLNYPVGVEWQGIFKYATKEEANDDDPGHYSVVTGLDLRKKMIYIADPFKHFAGRDRKLPLLTFNRRWWDINERINKKTNRTYQIDDDHLLFIITPKKETFPKKLKMKRG